MALTSGERAALWRKRQKEDPDKHKAYLQKEKERYKRRKEIGQIKSIENKTTREKRKTRRNWRKNQKAKRNRDQMILKHIEQTLSPPTSPPNYDQENIPLQNNVQRNESCMKNLGRKRVRRDRAKCYRELFKLRVDLDYQRRLKERYRKRAYRLNKCDANREVHKEIESKIQGKELQKALTLHVIMTRNMKEQYAETKSQREKSIIRQILWKNSILKKYRLGKYAMKETGISTKSNQNQRRRHRKTSGIKVLVTDFFERDDNSRVKGGKKATITKYGMKKQIHLLNDTVKNIHSKFLAENNTRISYSLFCKLKPFWVVKPNEKDRETCLCKIHENVQYKLNRMFHEKVIDSNNLDEALKQIVCDPNKKSCMYRECYVCQDKTIYTKNADGRQVWWYTWKNIRVERKRENENGEMESKKISRTVKDKEYGTLANLKTELMKELQRACRHVLNIRRQYASLKNLRESLDSDSVIVHIDFSENYGCKYEKEIQSMHFGASQRQISLHTGVAYLKTDTARTISFCTFSDCLKHTPQAIWAHLSPVLQYLKHQSDASCVHFVSDGPTTQYRSKTNLYLLSKEIFKHGFTKASWNFLEASHGKGAPDGIGAAIKRQADNLVNVQQRDIMSSQDLMAGLKNIGTKVVMFEIEESAIVAYDKEVDVALQTVPETMKIHQVLVKEKYQILSRVLCCFCNENCHCYNPVLTCFKVEETSDDTVMDNTIQDSSDMSAIQNDEILKKVTIVDEKLLGCFCVMKYDSLPYPGIILDVDDNEVEVNVMCRIGPNRFFWPLVEDRLWYSKSDIVTILDKEPDLVTTRHRQIEQAVWEAIVDELQLDDQGKVIS